LSLLTVSTTLIDLSVTIIVDKVSADLGCWRPGLSIANYRPVLTHRESRPRTCTYPSLAGFADAGDVFIDLPVTIVIHAVTHFRRGCTYTVSLVALSITVVVEVVGADLGTWRDLLSTHCK
jgi:thiamine phosphate synthase YjbQ (UPF0047 family)